MPLGVRKGFTAAHHMHTGRAKLHTKPLFQQDYLPFVAASRFILFELSGKEVTNCLCLNPVARL